MNPLDKYEEELDEREAAEADHAAELDDVRRDEEAAERESFLAEPGEVDVEEVGDDG